MKVNLTKQQSLILWNLIISGEESMKASEVRPELKPAVRQPLVDEKLIAIEKRRGTNYVVLKDKAWDWAIKNYDAEFPATSQTAATVLQKLLAKTGAYLQANDVSLVEFLHPNAETIAKVDKEVVSSFDLAEKIQSTYLQISKDQYNVRVRLAELRQALGSFPRKAVDQTLREMQLAEKLVLMPLDDPQEIASEDEDAAIDVAGNKRHILYMRR